MMLIGILEMPEITDLKPLEKLILEAIQAANGQWVTRIDITRAIGRPNGIQPNDLKALDQLAELGFIEARQAKRGLVGVKWEYKSKT